MDEVEIKTTFPVYWAGFRKVKKGHPKKDYQLISFDTETSLGRVFACGFHDGQNFTSHHGLEKKFSDILLSYLERQTAKRGIIAAAHYLKFDLGVIFSEILNPLRQVHRIKAPRESYFSILKSQTTIKIFWGPPCFAKIRFKRHDQEILMIDTYAFTMCGLDASLKAIGSPVEKLPKPKDLGKRVIPKKEVYPYLKNDTIGCWNLLKFIDGLCKSYDARFCFSLPMLAGWIFRHRFMQKDFARPPAGLLVGAMLSYHGGKNTFPGRHGWYKAWDLDIRSAYPEAMRQLPDFENGKWIRGEGRRFLELHPHGIYKISGIVKPCKWGVIFSHSFKKIAGSFSEIWVTGYEISEALRAGELELSGISGWGFQEGPEASENTAFKRFVSEFYAKKEEAKSKAMRDFFKLCLNAISGKAISRIQNENDDWVAGSMFDPAIASLITGFIRAKIHRLEHKYNALHTATDGIITTIRPDPADIGSEMGQLKQEVYGEVLLLRNKLYLHYDEAGILRKKGLHGFQGSPEDLLQMLREDRKYYTIERLVSWAESWHIKLPPGTPVKERRELKLGGSAWGRRIEVGERFVSSELTKSSI